MPPPRPVAPVGHRFGRLTVVADGGGDHWLFRCDCGVVKNQAYRNVRRGTIRSCGCLAREMLSERRKASKGKPGACRRHGHTVGRVVSPEYSAWTSMIGRTTRDMRRKYIARGIRICARWRSSFEAFLADMGPRPSAAYSVDRKDNDRGYSCGKCGDCTARGETPNCRWATAKEQSRNRTNNHVVSFRGEDRTVAEWSEITGVPSSVIYQRFRYGWPVERALTEHPRVRHGAGARKKAA